MPSGVYKRTEEARNNVGLSKRNEKHPKWKGEGAGYRAKHIWVETRLGKPHYCEICKKSDLKHRQYHWTNISGKYKRIISDWRRLCTKCHAKIDKNCGRGRPKKLLK